MNYCYKLKEKDKTRSFIITKSRSDEEEREVNILQALRLLVIVQEQLGFGRKGCKGAESAVSTYMHN